MSDIKVILATSPQLKRYVAKRALDYKLFYPEWSLEEQLTLVKEDQSTDLVDISVAVVQGKMVGVAMYFKPVARHIPLKFDPTVVMCYVKDEHRNKGIGTNLIKSFNVPTKEMTSYNGMHGTVHFWKKVGTNHRGWWSSPDW